MWEANFSFSLWTDESVPFVYVVGTKRAFRVFIILNSKIKLSNKWDEISSERF